MRTNSQGHSLIFTWLSHNRPFTIRYKLLCWAGTLFLTALFAESTPAASQEPGTTPVLLMNARIVDGTGTPPFVGDLLIEGEHIAEIGEQHRAFQRDGYEVATTTLRVAHPAGNDRRR